MKREKIKYILLILLIGLTVAMPQAYAKTSIEIKPSSIVYTNKTISEFFDESMGMKKAGEGLEGSNVDVHMATNRDWAVVVYFTNSAYGTGKGQETSISINGKSYSSTNGNPTGVMNWGKNYTVTSGVISNYTEIPETSTVYTNGKSIIENATNNRYVDVIENKTPQKDMAFNGSSVYIGSSVESPYSVRDGFYRLFVGYPGLDSNGGYANARVTFRPVIWN